MTAPKACAPSGGRGARLSRRRRRPASSSACPPPPAPAAPPRPCFPWKTSHRCSRGCAPRGARIERGEDDGNEVDGRTPEGALSPPVEDLAPGRDHAVAGRRGGRRRAGKLLRQGAGERGARAGEGHLGDPRLG